VYDTTFYFGGGGGIRTLETVSGLAVFKTTALNHYATPPAQKIITLFTVFLKGKAGIFVYNIYLLERCPSGRRSTLGKRVSGATRFEGSNPFLSAREKHSYIFVRVFFFH
jgi:hypothetical protein